MYLCARIVIDIISKSHDEVYYQAYFDALCGSIDAHHVGYGSDRVL